MSLRSTYESRKALLAQKLNDRGVMASASDGLTTLINKIDEIPFGPDVLTLNVDKNILNYRAHEYCTASIRLVNANNQPLKGKEINLLVKHNDTVIDSDTLITDSNGECSYRYDSAGAGDVVISAGYRMLLNEIYVNDAIFVDLCAFDSTSEYALADNDISLSFDTDHYILTRRNQNGWGSITHPLPSLNDFKIAFDIYFTNAQSNTQAWYGFYNTSTNKGYVCHLSPIDTRITVRSGDVLSNGTNIYKYQSFTRNKWYHCEFTVNNGVATAKLYDGEMLLNTVTLNNAGIFTDLNAMVLRSGHYPGSTHWVKNIIIDVL